MLTKDILFGMNILTLAVFVVMGITLTLNRTGQAGRALSIGLMAVGTALVFFGLVCRELVDVRQPRPFYPCSALVAYRTVVRLLQRRDGWRGVLGARG
jgi:hypothetical protein